ncbi:MAG: hypothetical protein KA099_06885 [Alphaproteobacteria bacterium]|nr:hypothetical protein [Alphaproteobacteria bacterium]MBP7759716.1 hypothetical protein [Alphaproteobacteria bacterium]MBP7762835.1 hypothetical protein [Alphaproteobacteria bacterium]MBP7905034.1 hypothetical protein [Alphaproteobacteria bacterium]
MKMADIKNEFFLSIIIMVALVAIFIRTSLPQEVQMEVSVRELIHMNSSEFIEVLKKNRLVYISEPIRDTTDKKYRVVGRGFLENWPDREDIPYLLSVTGSMEICGALEDPWSMYSTRYWKTFKSVNTVSIILLKAIKEGKFDIYSELEMPEDKEEIIAWAKAEAAKIEKKP